MALLLLGMLFLRFAEDILCSVFRKSKKIIDTINEVRTNKKIFKIINKRILVSFNISITIMARMRRSRTYQSLHRKLTLVLKTKSATGHHAFS